MTNLKPKSTAPKPVYLETILPPELVIKRMHDLLSGEQYGLPSKRPHYLVKSQKVLDHYEFEVQVMPYNQQDAMRHILGEVRELDIGHTIVEFEDPPPTQMNVYSLLAGLTVAIVIWIAMIFQHDFEKFMTVASIIVGGVVVLGGIVFLFNAGSQSPSRGMVDLVDPDIEMIKKVIQPRNEDRNLVAKIKQAQHEQMSSIGFDDEQKAQTQTQ